MLHSERQWHSPLFVYRCTHLVLSPLKELLKLWWEWPHRTFRTYRVVAHTHAANYVTLILLYCELVQHSFVSCVLTYSYDYCVLVQLSALILKHRETYYINIIRILLNTNNNKYSCTKTRLRDRLRNCKLLLILPEYWCQTCSPTPQTSTSLDAYYSVCW